VGAGGWLGSSPIVLVIVLVLVLAFPSLTTIKDRT
jgi:hypothetical protein